MLTDNYVTRCEAQHSDPVDGCLHCEARAETIITEPALDGGVILRDGFDREVCACGDLVVVDGDGACAFHYREASAIEATKILARIA